MTHRKKPGVAFWATVVVVVVLVAYPLSWGPILWLNSHDAIPKLAQGPIAWFYYPILWICGHVPTFGYFMVRYTDLWLT
jgi:hypothetical protein